MSRARIFSNILRSNGTLKDSALDNLPDIIKDSAYITPVVEAAGALDVYTNYDSLPTPDNEGRQAWVVSTGKFYIAADNVWRNVALLNLSPTMTLSPSGIITLATDGVTTSTVTITAQDSDDPNAILTYSVESDGNMLGRAVISQDSSVFTIRPLSEDSGATAGTFTLTFKTTDGVNIASDSADFSLTFSNVVDSSSATILLMKADGNNAVNSSRTFINSGGNESTLNLSGSTNTASISPYRSGGYSTYFDGSGDYLQYAASNSTVVNWHSQSTTMEAWIYLNSSSDHLYDYPFIFSNGEEPGASANTNYWGFGPEGATPYLKFQYYNGSTQAVTSSIQFPLHEWVHVAMVHNSSTIKLYQNGVEVASASVSGTPQNSSSLGLVTGGAKNGVYNGYIRDARLVHSAVYTAAFTPPTEALTAITNTQVLLCHLPYIADGSTNDFAITIGGNTKTVPFGPYDYEPWVEDDHQTSLYFNGSTIMYNTVGSAPGTGDFTYEGWIRCPNTSTGTGQYVFDTSSDGFGTGGLIFYIGTGGEFGAWADNGGVAISYLGTTKIYHNDTWFHFAWVRSGSTMNMYVDGKLASGPWTYTRNLSSTSIRFGASNRSTPSNYFTGDISNFRITNSAVYTAAFTPPTAPLIALTNNQFVLNPTPNIYDAAAAGRITLLGNAKSTTGQRKFTTSSALVFDGSGDGARFDGLTPEYLGGDFTIQFWLYPTTWYNSGTIFGHWVNGLYHPWVVYTSSTTDWKFYASSNGSTWNLVSAASVGIDRWTNSWKHVAMTYDQSAGTVKFWLDGSLESTHTGITGLTSNSYTSSVLSVASDQNGAAVAYAGYVQDVKVTRSIDYTAAFTPPTTEFEL